MPVPSDLVVLSCRLGRDPALTQGPGGNTSAKTPAGTLWVKASGRWLAEADRDGTFIELPIEPLETALATGDGEAAVAFLRQSTDAGRPSLETLLHVVLPHRVVAHVHSANALALAIRADAYDRFAERLDGLRWSWVPYAMPGAELGLVAQEHCKPDSDILVLANHGIVLGAPSADEAWALLEDIERRLHEAPRSSDAGPDNLDDTALPAGVHAARHPEVHALATDSASTAVVRRGSFFPDQVVFLGREVPPVFEDEHAVVPGVWRYGLVEGRGVVVSDDLTPGAEATLLALALAVARLDADAPLALLSEDDKDTLLTAESEQYRQALDRG